MGGYDQLCIVCGVSPMGGPTQFFLDHESSAIDMSEEIAKAIAPSNSTLTYEELLEIVHEALLEAYDHDWFADDLHRWPGFRTCIALGFFDDEDGAAELFPDELGKKTRFPNGLKVQTRPVCDAGAGGFGAVVGEEQNVYTHCTSWDRNNPNFFVSEGCYHYLQAWIDMRNLPPPNSSQTPGLSFAGELYEIVNSRKELRDPSHGLFPCIDYGGLEDSCEQYQDEFPPGPYFVNIARGIAEGLRGWDLLTDVMLDFNTWKFLFIVGPVRPIPTKAKKFMYSDVLPFAGHDEQVPVYSVNSPTVLDRVMKEMIGQGSLQWIMPVESMQGETERAVDAANNWLGYSQGISQNKEREAEQVNPLEEAHSDKNTVQTDMGSTRSVSTEGDDGEDTSEHDEQEEGELGPITSGIGSHRCIALYCVISHCKVI
ncbi:hypothetical protein BJ138DRAFT_1113617 [Hygrophoropsis aurantiaca]|uniref:Uncharacterized protein n=1 Tax=Hygrophoropsis aurantiaca TaxID=72124 RepID=A0ACB8AC47_9AGAM|nr:hypothetical protein BJ138DRAFT_1113617 [Hygrophoropsis aurantiaca]